MICMKWLKVQTLRVTVAISVERGVKTLSPQNYWWGSGSLQPEWGPAPPPTLDAFLPHLPESYVSIRQSSWSPLWMVTAGLPEFRLRIFSGSAAPWKGCWVCNPNYKVSLSYLMHANYFSFLEGLTYDLIGDICSSEVSLPGRSGVIQALDPLDAVFTAFPCLWQEPHVCLVWSQRWGQPTWQASRELCFHWGNTQTSRELWFLSNLSSFSFICVALSSGNSSSEFPCQPRLAWPEVTPLSPLPVFSSP